LSKKFIKTIVNDKRNRNLGTLQKQTAQMDNYEVKMLVINLSKT